MNRQFAKVDESCQPYQVRRVYVRAGAVQGPREQARLPQRQGGPRRRGAPGVVQDRAALGNTG